MAAIEPQVRGRVFERAADSRETVWGTILVYDPPQRSRFRTIGGLLTDQAQLIELSFAPEGQGTRAALTHSGWEEVGDPGEGRDIARSLRPRLGDVG